MSRRVVPVYESEVNLEFAENPAITEPELRFNKTTDKLSILGRAEKFAKGALAIALPVGAFLGAAAAFPPAIPLYVVGCASLGIAVLPIAKHYFGEAISGNANRNKITGKDLSGIIRESFRFFNRSRGNQNNNDINEYWHINVTANAFKDRLQGFFTISNDPCRPKYPEAAINFIASIGANKKAADYITLINDYFKKKEHPQAANIVDDDDIDAYRNNRASFQDNLIIPTYKSIYGTDADTNRSALFTESTLSQAVFLSLVVKILKDGFQITADMPDLDADLQNKIAAVNVISNNLSDENKTALIRAANDRLEEIYQGPIAETRYAAGLGRDLIDREDLVVAPAEHVEVLRANARVAENGGREVPTTTPEIVSTDGVQEAIPVAGSEIPSGDRDR